MNTTSWRFCPSETVNVLIHIDRTSSLGPPEVQTPPASTTTSLEDSDRDQEIRRDSSHTGDGRSCNERPQPEPDDKSPVS